MATEVRTLLSVADVAARFVRASARAREPIPESPGDAAEASEGAQHAATGVHTEGVPADSAVDSRAEAALALCAVTFQVLATAREDLLPAAWRLVTQHCGISGGMGGLPTNAKVELLNLIYTSLFLTKDAATMPATRRRFLATALIALEGEIALSAKADSASLAPACPYASCASYLGGYF